MSDSASAQLRRVLHLIPRLADGEEHTLVEVAAAAETSPADLMKDLEALSDRFGAPGGFVEGVSIFVDEGTVCVNASHFHRPMRLTMPELCALELGLTMLRRERTPAEQGPVDRALERLRQTISRVPGSDRHEGIRHAELAAAGSPEHLTALRTAVNEDRKVVLTYRAGSANDSSTRTIAPHSIMYVEQMWYLVAAAEDGGLRFYRLDRVEAVRLLDESFERQGDIDVRIRESGRAFSSATERRMTVRYSPRIARWVAEREGMVLAPDGSLEIEHPVADEAWAIRHVLQYGPDAELLGPPDLREVLVSRLEALMRQIA